MRPSSFVTFGIGGLAVVIASAFVFGYASAVARTGGNRVHARMVARSALLAWMAMFAALASSGTLSDTARRPPPLLMAMTMFVVSGLVLGASRVGDTFARGVPRVAIVAAQGVRLPLAIVMHRAALEGVLPVELTYAGYNFDVLAGASALALAYFMRKQPVQPRVLFAWNVFGSISLAVMLALLVLASPLVRAFGDAPQHVNTLIAQFPFIWLGTVLIAAAVFGHVVTFRTLRAWRPSSSSPAPS